MGSEKCNCNPSLRPDSHRIDVAMGMGGRRLTDKPQKHLISVSTILFQTDWTVTVLLGLASGRIVHGSCWQMYLFVRHVTAAMRHILHLQRVIE
jgi:hypothetical protein